MFKMRGGLLQVFIQGMFWACLLILVKEVPFKNTVYIKRGNDMCPQLLLIFFNKPKSYINL